MKIKSFLFSFIVFGSGYTMADFLEKRTDLVVNSHHIAQRAYTPVSMKYYRSSGGNFITFVIDVDRKIDEVKSKSEYIGYTFDDGKAQINMFVDAKRMPVNLVKSLEQQIYNNKTHEVFRAVEENFNFEVRKRTLFINFNNQNRATASKE
jgi:hypothetical protein